jgi:hypothetical protein
MLEMHRDAQGAEILIAAMDDTHLMNTVRLRCRQIKTALNSSATITDPTQAALYGIKAKSAEEAGEAARKVVTKTYPYLADALLRGGEVAAVCASEIRNALGRENTVALSITHEAIANTNEEFF